jgi:3-isopropylmalate/(R)-2-methylmalate dehydratase small subunit
VAESPALSGRARLITGVVSTDDILPARYKHSSTDPAVLARHVFEHLRPDLGPSLRPGDMIVSRDTFGIGSSREQAVSALKAAGVRALLAPRFGRILFRNAWNLGIAAIALDTDSLSEGDLIDLELASGTCRAAAAGILRFAAPAPTMLHMLDHGGLLAMVRETGGLRALDGGKR